MKKSNVERGGTCATIDIVILYRYVDVVEVVSLTSLLLFVCLLLVSQYMKDHTEKGERKDHYAGDRRGELVADVFVVVDRYCG